MENKENRLIFPKKCNLFDVLISQVNFDETIKIIINASMNSYPAIVAHLPVYGVVGSNKNNDLNHIINNFDLVTADGQPVRWALNWFCKSKLKDRVSGPDIMLALCEKAAEQNISIYLYGSTQEVINKLKSNLTTSFQGLKIAGYESPPFRELTDEEDESFVERVNNSGAKLLFLGLGFPKQEKFAYIHRNRVKAVQLCVGAAFEYFSGNEKRAPVFLQKIGMEWAYRVFNNPKRLFRRYFYANTFFIMMTLIEIIKRINRWNNIESC
jgi:N-acetylglucosaminyldiphosphoundecaprenol N-acetyl-beta-D-mannosaminyltransferase